MSHYHGFDSCGMREHVPTSDALNWGDIQAVSLHDTVRCRAALLTPTVPSAREEAEERADPRTVGRAQHRHGWESLRERSVGEVHARASCMATRTRKLS